MSLISTLNIDGVKYIFGKSGVDTDDATALSTDILLGKTAYARGLKLTGTIESVGAKTIIPNTSNQMIESGKYLSGNITIQGDPNLISENIMSGKSIFGISGNGGGIIPLILSGESWANSANLIERFASNAFSKSSNNVWQCTKKCAVQIVCIAFSSGGVSTTSAVCKGITTTASVSDGGPYASIVTNIKISQKIDLIPGDNISVSHTCGYHTNTGFIIICPV